MTRLTRTAFIALATAAAALLAGCNIEGVSLPWSTGTDDGRGARSDGASGLASPAGGRDGATAGGRASDGGDRKIRLARARATRPGRDEPRERYTVWLTKAVGPNHKEQAREVARRAEKRLGLSDVFTAPDPDDPDESIIYCGSHPSRKEALAAAGRLRETTSRDGVKPFFMAHPVADPREQPGPARWNLANAPEAVLYSVAVEEYHNDKELNFYSRKHVAAARCGELRRAGEPAYFYHGPVRSYVSIGLFGADAIQEVQERAPGERSRHGDGVLTKEQIADPAMLEILRRHPQLYVNGMAMEVSIADVRSQKARMVTKPTFPFRIPGREEEQDADAPRPDFSHPEFR